MSRWSDERELHPHFEIGVLVSYFWTTAASSWKPEGSILKRRNVFAPGSTGARPHGRFGFHVKVAGRRRCHRWGSNPHARYGAPVSETGLSSSSITMACERGFNDPRPAVGRSPSRDARTRTALRVLMRNGTHLGTSRALWPPRWDSNPRPLASETSALFAELRGEKSGPPGRTRTSNLLIRNQVPYPLSHERKREASESREGFEPSHSDLQSKLRTSESAR